MRAYLEERGGRGGGESVSFPACQLENSRCLPQASFLSSEEGQVRVGVAEQDGPTIWKITSSIQALASKRLLTKQISSVHFESQNQTWKDFLADFKAGSLCEILFVPAEMPLALHDCSQTGEMNGLRSALEIEYDLHDVRQRALLFFFLL